MAKTRFEICATIDSNGNLKVSQSLQPNSSMQFVIEVFAKPTLNLSEYYLSMPLESQKYSSIYTISLVVVTFSVTNIVTGELLSSLPKELVIPNTNFGKRYQLLQTLLYRGVNVKFNVTIAISQNTPCTFLALYDDEELTDFELRGTDGAVKVHKTALAAASPVLKQMLLGTWKEATEGFVEIPETTQQTLKHLKNYIYMGTLAEDTEEVKKLFQLASCYMIKDLMKKCVDRLVYTLNAKNIYKNIQFAVNYEQDNMLLLIMEKLHNREICLNEIRKYCLKRKESPTTSQTQAESCPNKEKKSKLNTTL